MVLLLTGGGSCSSNTPGGGAGGNKTDAAGGTGGDAGPVVACLGAGAPRKNMGTVCGCDSDCDSGFCVDGVCCGTACQDKCKACNVPGMMGTCSFVPPGVKPRLATTCAKSDVATCGIDGTCDGSGDCRKYPAGTTCLSGACDGAAVAGINVCNGTGRCIPGSLKICVPYTCNVARKDCAASCTSNADCSADHACVNGSCGPKPKGAVCTNDAECAGEHCYDGVCCETSCKGACVACNLVGYVGTCVAIAAGIPDPRGICKDKGATTCGETGSCDGLGACDKYAEGIICAPPVCATPDRLTTAQTCDGNGTCRAAGANDCPPYRCGEGACKSPCKSDNDCQAGHACVMGSCGPKQNGQACTAPSDCASNFCVDGVCCNDSCQGGCRSCALATSKGTCTNLPAGATDTRNVCKDQGVASCKTDGRCDGGGGCRRYKLGTPCANESCLSNVYTAQSTCDGISQCVAPSSRTCAPFACNGSKCFDACTKDSNCVLPNVCNGNSCGKKMNGASCNNGLIECMSGICAQGVCCGSPCAGPCKSCALSNSQGTCTNLPAGQADNTNTCIDQGPAGCGNNGKCEAGACQKYARGTSCKDPTCPANTTNFTPRSTCDGSGACVTPMGMTCAPYRCGVMACKGTCTADADCASGQVCTNGSCGLKPNGGSCTTAAECGSKFCAAGICCNTACTSACNSCNLPGDVGTCKPLAQNAPDSRCVDQGAASCGTNGRCDGNGACGRYPSGTECVGPTCPLGTPNGTLAKTCDGAGACRLGGGPNPCGAFLCGPNKDCLHNCGSNADCVSPNMCDLKINRCGDKKPAGEDCVASGECQTGLFCTDGVCCGSNSCSTCQACNVRGKRGHCDNVLANDPEPHNLCTTQNPLVCGTTGKCDGGGACSFVVAGTTCGTATCNGNIVVSPGSCNGAGTCAAGTSTPCSTCQTCSAGACINVGAGAADPTGTCKDTGVAMCGTKATCAAGGMCATYATEMCAPATCIGNTAAGPAFCTAAPGCPAAMMMKPCGDYKCINGICPITCQADSDCFGGLTCSALGDPNGTCGTKKRNGGACTGNDGTQCVSGNCVDGICCNMACAGPCKSCGNGTCTNFAVGAMEPKCNGSEAPGACGNRTTCAAGGQCATHAASEICAPASCTGSTLLAPTTCGSGSTCPAQTMMTSCNEYKCNAEGTACRSSCTTNTDCAGSNVCNGTTCGPMVVVPPEDPPEPPPPPVEDPPDAAPPI